MPRGVVQVIHVHRRRAPLGAKTPRVRAIAHRRRPADHVLDEITVGKVARLQAAVEEGEIRVADLVRLVMFGVTGNNPPAADEASNYLPWDTALGETGAADHYRSAAWAESAVSWLWNVANSFPSAIEIGAYLEGLQAEAAALPANQDRNAHIEMVLLSHTAALALAVIPNAKAPSIPSKKLAQTAYTGNGFDQVGPAAYNPKQPTIRQRNPEFDFTTSKINRQLFE